MVEVKVRGATELVILHTYIYQGQSNLSQPSMAIGDIVGGSYDYAVVNAICGLGM